MQGLSRESKGDQDRGVGFGHPGRMATHPVSRPPETTSPIAPALRLIAEDPFERLTLARLADASGLSAFHFARLFTAVMGVSAIGYVRRMRLVAAARRLAEDPGLRLIDLALDCGFESQEAFTRAFARAFGLSPGQFRRAHLLLQPEGVPMMDETAMDLERTLVAEKELVARGPFRVAGLRGEYDADTRHEIPRLWERLAPRLPLPGQVGGEAYGICWSTGPDCAFRYMAAVALAEDAAVPEGLESLTVPGQTYLVFRQKVVPGPFHPQVAAAMGEIWGRRVPASGHKPSGGPDFEFYPPDLVPGVTEGWIAYYVPVEV